MNKDKDFSIIFEKLSEVSQELELYSELVIDPNEFEEISELRRLAIAISEPEPTTYTST